MPCGGDTSKSPPLFDAVQQAATATGEGGCGQGPGCFLFILKGLYYDVICGKIRHTIFPQMGLSSRYMNPALIQNGGKAPLFELLCAFKNCLTTASSRVMPRVKGISSNTTLSPLRRQ